MNKNNFFVKFAYFYTGIFKRIKELFIDVWYAITDSYFLGSLATIITFPICLAFNILSLFFPLKIVLAIILSVYLGDEALEKLDVNNKAGYYLKSAVKKRKAELEKKAHNEAS